MQTDTNLALGKSKRELEEVNAKLAEAQSKHQGLLSELNAKKAEADASSEEAARRIKLGNDQVTELMRVKNELQEREKALKADESRFVEHERLVAKREKELQEAEVDYVKRSQALKAREQKFKEAMS